MTGPAHPDVSVLVVDDHSAIAAAIASSLRAAGFGEVQVAGEFDALGLTAMVRPGTVVLLDHQLGEGVRAVSLIGPLVDAGAVVLLFTGLASVVERSDALVAGAVGVLDKAMPFDDLVAAVLAAAGGRDPMRAVDRAALLRAGTRARTERELALAPFDLLTAKESIVLAHLIAGTGPAAIAEAEHVSLPTVRTHIRSVLVKLGVHSQREAIALSRKVGWDGNHQN